MCRRPTPYWIMAIIGAFFGVSGVLIIERVSETDIMPDSDMSTRVDYFIFLALCFAMIFVDTERHRRGLFSPIYFLAMIALFATVGSIASAFVSSAYYDLRHQSLPPDSAAMWAPWGAGIGAILACTFFAFPILDRKRPPLHPAVHPANRQLSSSISRDRRRRGQHASRRRS